MHFRSSFNCPAARSCLLFIGAAAIFALLPLIVASKVFAQEKSNSPAVDYWKKQNQRALEERSEKVGLEAEGLEIPAELSGGGGGVGNQLAKMTQLVKDTGFKMPMDFADLAKQRADGTLIDVPLVTEHYFLDIGGSATEASFASFSFPKGSSKLSPSGFKLLSALARDFDGTKYDLNQPADRRQMRLRLLRMLNPAAKIILEEIAAEYEDKFDRPLRVISLVRSMDYQVELNRSNPDSYRVNGRGSMPPHVSGLAFDIGFRHMTAAEQNFLMRKIAELEKEGKIDGLRETGTSQVFHVFVYPQSRSGENR